MIKIIFSFLIILSLGLNISASDYTEVNCYDIFTFKMMSGGGFNEFVNQKFLALEAANVNIAEQESLSLRAIAQENLYDYGFRQYFYQSISVDDSFLQEVVENHRIKIDLFLFGFQDSLQAEQIRENLAVYNNDSVSLMDHIDSVYLEVVDQHYATVQTLTWENLFNPIRDEVFSLEDFEVGNVVKFPTMFLIPIRLSSDSISQIELDTMPQEWFAFLMDMRKKEHLINSMLNMLATPEMSYDQASFDFMVSVDSAKFDSSPIPYFPNITPQDSQRILAYTPWGEVTLGEAMVRLRRKGFFPKFSETSNFKYMLEKEIIFQDYLVDQYNQQLQSDQWLWAKIRFLSDQYLRDKLVNNIADTIFVDMEEMEQWYQTHQDNYRRDESYRYSIILVPDSIFADSLRNLVVQGYSMDSLAREFSIHPTADKGGDGGWRERSRGGTLKPMFQELELGDVSDLFKTIDGWSFIKIIDARESYVIPLDSLHVQVVNECRREKINKLLEQYYQQLKDKYQLELNFENCSEVFNSFLIDNLRLIR